MAAITNDIQSANGVVFFICTENYFTNIATEIAAEKIAGLMDAGFKAVHLYIMNKGGMATDVIQRLRDDNYL